ncbi:MAG: response regulator [Bacteroidetes bacterium]|nr:MAG: response regulator [Bacteroidota bacterium]
MTIRGKTNKLNKTILLVDDERPWLDIMSHVLKEKSFKVMTAESGTEALKKLQARKPDLILSDVRMPEMNGFDLYQHVRSEPKNKGIPYVFMSSIDDYDAIHVAKELGADGYVAKPYDIDDAKSTINQLLVKFVNPTM